MEDDFDAALEADDNGGVGGPEAPAKAVETACHTEEQRATLARALRTIIGAVYARGFDIKTVAGHEMPEGCSSTHPALEAPLAEFAVPARCAFAANEREVLVVGVVPATGPRPGTTAAAHELAPGSHIAVVCISTGDVKPVREAVFNMRRLMDGMHLVTVILVSFARLTPFTKREIGDMSNPSVQYFNVVDDLQQRVLDHALVQPHVPLTPEEARRARQRFKGSPGEPTLFSTLSSTEPPVRLLGLRVGDLVHVTETWGRSPPHDTVFEVADVQKAT